MQHGTTDQEDIPVPASPAVSPPTAVAPDGPGRYPGSWHPSRVRPDGSHTAGPRTAGSHTPGSRTPGPRTAGHRTDDAARRAGGRVAS